MKQFLLNTCCTALTLAFSLSIGFAAEPIKSADKGIAPAAVKAESSKPAEAKKSVEKRLEPVDINSASDAQLKAIPGLGDAYITKIVANRPYANKSQLVSRKVLPETVYEKVKDRIIAKQPQKDGKTPKPDPKKK